MIEVERNQRQIIAVIHVPLLRHRMVAVLAGLFHAVIVRAILAIDYANDVDYLD
ncbi:hypothetical protein [uncultured Desulfobulbus sp.]|uniref:hypothetical protein n=1 Tax=uncultured Desulfobulbus sp. TaxID=239745 RepID=UPI0029C8AD17|nr:hypothetical protein [uncultured Desulfobulbus sp.]